MPTLVWREDREVSSGDEALLCRSFPGGGLSGGGSEELAGKAFVRGQELRQSQGGGSWGEVTYPESQGGSSSRAQAKLAAEQTGDKPCDGAHSAGFQTCKPVKSPPRAGMPRPQSKLQLLVPLSPQAQTRPPDP